MRNLIGFIGEELLVFIKNVQKQKKISKKIVVAPEANFSKDMGFNEIMCADLFIYFESKFDVYISYDQRKEIKIVYDLVRTVYNLLNLSKTNEANCC